MARMTEGELAARRKKTSEYGQAVERSFTPLGEEEGAASTEAAPKRESPPLTRPESPEEPTEEPLTLRKKTERAASRAIKRFEPQPGGEPSEEWHEGALTGAGRGLTDEPDEPTKAPSTTTGSKPGWPVYSVQAGGKELVYNIEGDPYTYRMKKGEDGKVGEVEIVGVASRIQGGPPVGTVFKPGSTAYSNIIDQFKTTQSGGAWTGYKAAEAKQAAEAKKAAEPEVPEPEVPEVEEEVVEPEVSEPEVPEPDVPEPEVPEPEAAPEEVKSLQPRSRQDIEQLIARGDLVEGAGGYSPGPGLSWANPDVLGGPEMGWDEAYAAGSYDLVADPESTPTKEDPVELPKYEIHEIMGHLKENPEVYASEENFDAFIDSFDPVLQGDMRKLTEGILDRLRLIEQDKLLEEHRVSRVASPVRTGISRGLTPHEAPSQARSAADPFGAAGAARRAMLINTPRSGLELFGEPIPELEQRG